MGLQKFDLKVYDLPIAWCQHKANSVRKAHDSVQCVDVSEHVVRLHTLHGLCALFSEAFRAAGWEEGPDAWTAQSLFDLAVVHVNANNSVVVHSPELLGYFSEVSVHESHTVQDFGTCQHRKDLVQHVIGFHDLFSRWWTDCLGCNRWSGYWCFHQNWRFDDWRKTKLKLFNIIALKWFIKN